MSLPVKNENYKDVDYWDKRYWEEDSYEWCKDYTSFKELFNSAVPNKNDSILVIGCGNSNLSLDLYKDGYQFISNIDYSSVVVEKMKEKHGDLMEYSVMDMRNIDFNKTFDIVVEKSVLDVLLTSEKSLWELSPDTQSDIESSLSSILRVLNPDGRFISITFGEPYFRKQLYAKHFSDVQVHSFGDFFHYYFYVARNPLSTDLRDTLPREGATP